jgi:hypothetical protein
MNPTEQEMIGYDQVWEAEFRGFFWGEGTLGFRPNHPFRRLADGRQVTPVFTIHASIGLRWDDRYILTKFQERFGGVIRQEKYKKDPGKFIARWEVSDTDCNLEIYSILSHGTNLPFNKKRQLELWHQALKIKKGAEGRVLGGKKGSRYTDEERQILLPIAKEIRELKEYQPDWLTE